MEATICSFSCSILNRDGQTDIRALTYSLRHNLRTEASNISFFNVHPTAGETITVTAEIENTGDYAEDSVLAQLFVGDPANGGVLIDSSRPGRRVDPPQSLLKHWLARVPRSGHRRRVRCHPS